MIMQNEKKSLSSLTQIKSIRLTTEQLVARDLKILNLNQVLVRLLNHHLIIK